MVEDAKRVIDTSAAHLGVGEAGVREGNAQDKSPGMPLYRHSVLAGFDNGCLLDLRVRGAMQLLSQSPMFAGMWDAPRAAKLALDTVTELLRLAEERGLVDALPDDDSINSQVRKQARRMARFNVENQLSAQRFAQEDSPAVRPIGTRN